jgi:hypothetical protein
MGPKAHLVGSEGTRVMNRHLLGYAMASALLCIAGMASAAPQFATAADAKAMLDRAVAALKSNETTALSAFNDPNDKQFHDRDINVFCFRLSDGTITAYSSPGLLGIDIRTLALKDDPIGKRTYDTVATAPEGSTVTMDYNFPKPGTSGPAAKQSLEARVGDQACAVGYFK